MAKVLMAVEKCLSVARESRPLHIRPLFGAPDFSPKLIVPLFRVHSCILPSREYICVYLSNRPEPEQSSEPQTAHQGSRIVRVAC